MDNEAVVVSPFSEMDISAAIVLLKAYAMRRGAVPLVVQLIGNPGWRTAAERYLARQAERRQRGEPVDIRYAIAEICDQPIDTAPYAEAPRVVH